VTSRGCRPGRAQVADARNKQSVYCSLTFSYLAVRGLLIWTLKFTISCKSLKHFLIFIRRLKGKTASKHYEVLPTITLKQGRSARSRMIWPEPELKPEPFYFVFRSGGGTGAL